MKKVKKIGKNVCLSLLTMSMVMNGMALTGHAVENSNLEKKNFVEWMPDEQSEMDSKEVDGDIFEELSEYHPFRNKAVSINSYASSYGREWLKEFFEDSKKAEKAQRLYNAISEYILAFQEGGEDAINYNGTEAYYFPQKLSISSIGNFTRAETYLIYLTVRADHPNLYVCDGVMHYYSTSDRTYVSEITVNCSEEYIKASKRAMRNTEIEKNIERYLECVVGLNTDLEKEIAIHNKMLAELDYGYDENGNPQDGKAAHSIVSVFDDDRNTMPVCEGYAKAFQLLLNACGIDNLYVSGTANGGSHAWNMLELDGQYYYADVTFDDSRYRVMEKEYLKSHANNSDSYTPEDVATWVVEESNLSWSGGVPCTIDNILYPYMNKSENSFKDHIADTPFQNGEDDLSDRQYGLPGAAGEDYNNQIGLSSYVKVEYQTDFGELKIYNQGILVPSGHDVYEGTKLTAIWVPKKLDRDYKLYMDEKVIDLERQDGSYRGKFVVPADVDAITISIRDNTIDVSGIELDQSEILFHALNEKKTLTANVIPSNAFNKQLKWKSSDEHVAKVENGIVTAMGNGKATITAETVEGSFIATCDVVVSYIPDEEETSSTGESETPDKGEEETSSPGESETPDKGEEETSSPGESETPDKGEEETSSPEESETPDQEEQETSGKDKPGTGNSNGSGSSSSKKPSISYYEAPNSTDKLVWENSSQGWKYKDTNGQYIKAQWAKIDNNWYYFADNAYIKKGWFQAPNGIWYMLDDMNGDMKTGWYQENNIWYYLDEVSGEMKTSWQKINDQWYYLDDSGKMKTDWLMQGGKWYYLREDGSMATGWQIINGDWYYLLSTGECLINMVTPDGYSVDENGRWIS